MIFSTQATFTRPADTTAYASGDLVANSTTAGSVVPLKFILSSPTFKLWRVGIKFNSATPTNAKFNLNLYSSSPTCTNGDNGAWLTTESGYQGFVSVDASTNTFSDNTTGWGYGTSNQPLPIQAPLNTQVLYGLLSATAAYTPTSGEIFTVTLVGEV
jgi:hypothetical protein